MRRLLLLVVALLWISDGALGHCSDGLGCLAGMTEVVNVLFLSLSLYQNTWNGN